MKSSRVLLLALVSLAALTLRPDASRACGPFMPTIVFVRSTGPDAPLDGYLDGAIGLVDGRYCTEDLALAYRHFVGLGIDAEERASILERRSRPRYAPDEREAPWLVSRARVLVTAPESVTHSFTGTDYESIDNCSADAFVKAASTLDARVAALGARSPEVLRFVEAQDGVFMACARDRDVALVDPPAEATQRERDDRAYQRAALDFYRGEYGSALGRFEAIAASPSSEWRHAARYVVARVHQRLSYDEGRHAPELVLAVATLDAILADPEMSAWHGAARRYRDFVRARLDPTGRAHELAIAIAAAHQGAALGEMLADLETLSDTVTFAGGAESDRLGVFIETLRNPSEAAARRAAGLHRRTHSPAFLVAALAAMRSPDSLPRAELDALLAEAAALPTSHPAYVSALVHRARLLLERESTDRRAIRHTLLEARDAIGASRGPSAAHALTLLAFAYAGTIDEAVATAGAATTVDEDTPWIGEELEPSVDVGSLGFDFHAHAKRLLDRLPLAEWVRFARGTSLPAEARDELATVAYGRALLTNDDESRHALAPMMVRQYPALAREIQAIESSSSSADRRYARIWLMLHAPAMRVELDENARLEDDGFTSSASYYCVAPPALDADGNLAHALAPALDRNEARLLARARGSSREAIASLPPAGVLLAREAVAAATARPRDPRNPELLARAVRATRWACPGSGSRAASRDAFRLLHARYPDSEAARRTRYFYGEP